MDREQLELRARRVLIDGCPDDEFETALLLLEGEVEVLSRSLRGGSLAVLPLLDDAQELFAHVTRATPNRYRGAHAMIAWLYGLQRDDRETFARLLKGAGAMIERAWLAVATQLERVETTPRGDWLRERTLEVSVGDAATLLERTRHEIRRAIDRGALARVGHGRIEVPLDRKGYRWALDSADVTDRERAGERLKSKLAALQEKTHKMPQ